MEDKLIARGIDPKWKNKIIVVDSAEVESDDFKDPTKYYYQNAFGDNVYLKTRSYTKAREMIDEITGKKGFYSVRTSGVV